jgi:molecular chaperone GrpE (heat shock protein)
MILALMVLVEQKALRSPRIFPKLPMMNDATNWKVPKWPFLLGNALLLAFAYFIVLKSPHPIGKWEIIACFASAAFGALIGVVPFILDYRAMGKLIEVNALGEVSEKIQNLEKLAAQISSATNQLADVQETVKGSSDKTIAAAKGIAEKMASEVREFSEFMQKMNNSEKAALRLEVEKSRRGETEWLQVLVHILDHIFALHGAAVRSGQSQVVNQIAHFQNACRGTVRRIGLAAFVPVPGEPFNVERHQVPGGKEKPSADAVVAETIAAGYTFQGKLFRPAMVRLREKDLPAATTIEKTIPVPSLKPENSEDELSLESPD